MKKTKGIALVAGICLIVAMVACAAPAPDQTPAPAPAPAPTPAKVLHLKMQTNVVPEETERDYRGFVDGVEEMTDGQIVIELYSIGALIPIKEQLDAVAERVIDMGAGSEGYYSGVVPVTEIASGIPLTFTNIYEGDEFVYKYGFRELLREEYAKHNVYFIPGNSGGTGLMTNKPIKKASDFQGMKLRSFGAMAEWLTKLGAETVYIPGGELYTALATGVVEGGHWGPAGPMYEMKFHEVLKYIMEPPAPIAWQLKSVHVNLDLWNSLSPQDQAIIETAITAWVAHGATRDVEMLNVRALVSMVNEWDVTVVRPPEDEIAKMREASLEVMDDLAEKDPVNAKAIAMLKDYLRGLGHIK